MVIKTETGVEVRQLSDEEWEQLADDKARERFGVSAAELMRQLESGEIDIDDDPDLPHIVMLLGPRGK